MLHLYCNLHYIALYLVFTGMCLWFPAGIDSLSATTTETDYIFWAS